MQNEWSEKAVFLEALRLAPHERGAYLDRACPDAAKRDRIEELLAAHARGLTSVFETAMTVDLPLPTQIDEFRIIRKVGEGGMGVVYLAEDTVLGRQVALKILVPELTDSEAALGRFRDEARSAAVLNHPAIVPVYKFGFDGERHYLVSEYVEGQTLAAVIEAETARRRTSTDTSQFRAWFRNCAEIIAVIADALEISHRAGIIHRDVKPSNILIDRVKGPRLTDFGIAKHLDGGRTHHTDVIGSCHYMSPEQATAANQRVDQRSDIFSLGVVLYELLSLQRPFNGRDIHHILRAVVEYDPPRLRSVLKQIPKDLETICAKAMEKAPARRYPSAAHVGADLRAFLAQQPILANPPSRARRIVRWLARRPVPVAIVAATVAIVCSLTFAYWLDYTYSETQAWLRIDGHPDGTTVIAQPVDRQSYELGAPRKLGVSPLAQRVPPGQYRLTLAPPASGGPAEVNTIAIFPGRANELHVVLHAIGETPTIPAAIASHERHLFFSSDQREPADMVLIDAGAYPIGWSDREGPLTKRRTIQLPAFWIDRYQVSNQDYKDFLTATGYPPPDEWPQIAADASLQNRPVTCVNLEDAEAYARWQRKRLPTALEWEAAARGAEGRLYPWGDDLTQLLSQLQVDTTDLRVNASWSTERRWERYRARTLDVRTTDATATPHGLAQMFGNVRELTATINEARREVVLFGRSWADPPDEATLPMYRMYPMSSYSIQLGFRCARSADAPH